MTFSAKAYLQQVFRHCVRTEADLNPDQREAVGFMYSHPFSALFLDVGYGKTVITLTMLRRLIVDDGYEGKILIIAPIRVANRVWPFEPRLWRHLAWMDVAVLRIEDDDSRLKEAHWSKRTAVKNKLRSELLDSPEQIHVINQEAVDWLVEKCAVKRKWPYKIVIFDESSRLRDHRSKTFKAIKKVRPHIDRFHELTATPASQTYQYFFSQVWLLDKGERFGNSITPFRKRYFNYDPYKQKYELRPGAAEEMERLIADICLVKRRDRDFEIRIRSIRLSFEVMEAYRRFERELVLQLSDDVAIDAINGGVLCGKLLQYASGFVYDEKKVRHAIHDEKIEELKSLIDETLDEPVIVAYWFKGSLRRLREAFPQAAVMDKAGRIEESWNKRKHKMLLLHPQSAGHGMNLQAGGYHLAVFDMFHSLELFTQLIGRLDRPGQTNTVMVHLLCAKGTMDNIVARNLQKMRTTEEDMFSRLREIRRTLREAA